MQRQIGAGAALVSIEIEEETDMTDAGNLQGIRLRQLLLWAALFCWPMAQAFGTQPLASTVSPAATTTQRGGFVATGSLNVARWEHRATLLPNGKVLVTGGRPGSGGAEFAELYDPATGTWTRTGDEACTPEWHRTVTLLANGKVLVAGAGCAELYDPATGAWTRTGDGRLAARAQGEQIGGRTGPCRGRNLHW
jgi:Galactose oxidase, central domain